jgi:hypothetical protein
MHLTGPSTAISVSSEQYLNACFAIRMTLLNTFSWSCAYGYALFDITRSEGIEFLEKGLVIDIVRTVTGERHTDLAVDPIDRTIAHVDRLVGCSQTPELLENRKDIHIIDQRLKMIDGAVAKLAEKVR